MLVKLRRGGYSGPIVVASISEAKNRLSALIDHVRAGDTVVIVDRGIPVARLEPRGDLAGGGALAARAGLGAWAGAGRGVRRVGGVGRGGGRLLRVHELRAGDSLQRGAALVAPEGPPASLEFVSLDERLVDAA